MVTLLDILREEDGKLFSHLPDSLDSSMLSELINLKLPEGGVINNIEYNPKFAKFFKRFIPEELEALYYMSLGYSNLNIAQKIPIDVEVVGLYLNNVNVKVNVADYKNRRVATAMAYRKAYPHLFPIRQYDPIKLSDGQYEVARWIAEGHNNSSIAEQPNNPFKVEGQDYSESTVHSYTANIYKKIKKQFPLEYHMRVQLAILFNSGAIYNESHNPKGIG